MEKRLPRKLTAILYTDMVEYSRLTGEDEDATHRRLRDYLDLISSAIESAQGVVVHYAGDAVLAKFDAVVDALSCAITIQTSLKDQNQDLPDERKVRFRIGVNLGDVIEDRADIYGDGVNVAARLESLAEPGGICISESVKTAIGKNLPYHYAFMGERRVKNIEEPVRAYSVEFDDDGLKSKNSAPTAFLQSQNLTLPEKPSIAVLAFKNMSGDPEQEYFSDGITEDIITELSRFSGLFVIARNSSFAFKNQSVDVKTVAQELGVRYMLEGSVRRMRNRLRINAQLLDTEMATHIWAERYDGDLTDVFELQDEITRSIVGSIAPQIEIAEVERSRKLSDANLSSYEISLKAQAIFYDCAREGNPELRQKTIEAAQAALDIDPRNTLALWIQGYSYLMQYLYRWSSNPEECLNLAQEISQRLLQADSSDPRAYMTRAMISTFRGEFDAALADFRRAFDLNPNFALNLTLMAWGESLAGMTADAKHHAELALRLSPRDLDLWLGDAYLTLLQANFAESDFEEAKKWGLLAVQMTPKAPIRLALMTASCIHTNDPEGAAYYARKLEELSPDFIPSLLSGAVTLYKTPEHNLILIDGLHKAGFT